MIIVSRLKRLLSDRRTQQLYAGKDFIDGYIAHTNARVARDPKAAIGGMWDEIGTLQFEFMCEMGLRPHHRLLDLGCGTLRGGRHFIGYLDTGNYVGIDISPACIAAGEALVREEGLVAKAPRLIVNTSKELRFEEFAEDRFDFILAQSVFTHLPEDLIVECFEHVTAVMADGAAFYFTYNESDSSRRIGLKDFVHPWSLFDRSARDNGLVVTDMSDRYGHLRGQRMVKAERS